MSKKDAKIQYLRKNGRNKGVKKGVIVACVNPDDPSKVIVGFSMCHPTDRFDFISGEKRDEFGFNLAKIRAVKYSEHEEFFVQNTHTEDQIDEAVEETHFLTVYENPEPERVVEVPASVFTPLASFIERCILYYKDKSFPDWTMKVIAEEQVLPVPKKIECPEPLYV